MVGWVTKVMEAGPASKRTADEKYTGRPLRATIASRTPFRNTAVAHRI